MRLLDLYCGAGGAARGYELAGFTDIVGVDINPQPNYPYTFWQGDALKAHHDINFNEFDLIHASPPCQRFSPSTLNNDNHPDLIDHTRANMGNHAYVIENVTQAPIRRDLVLCGSMFGLDIQRHRAFELAGFPLLLAPACNHKEWTQGRPYTITGHGGGNNSKHSLKPGHITQWQTLMEMPWAKPKQEIAEAIPPAYTEYIGRAFIETGAST